MFEVSVSSRGIEPFVELLGEERIEAVRRVGDSVRDLLGSRAIWNITSSSATGGVSDMLRSTLRYARGLGVQTRWLVLEGHPDFFRLTKRIQDSLYGFDIDGMPLGTHEARLYEQVMRDNSRALIELVKPGDLVICHDVQSAGFVPYLIDREIPVMWRCHVGREDSPLGAERGWAFLRPYLEHVPLAVFSRAAYAPSWMPHRRTVVIPPSIDPFSAKNHEMDEATVRNILGYVGLTAEAPSSVPLFTRDDGSVGRFEHTAEVCSMGSAPSCATPLVVQVSRWERAKDALGVMSGFARLVQTTQANGARLVIAGPNAHGVLDDPDGPEVFEEVEHAWRALPDGIRQLITLAQLPTADTEESAAIVNALQRHATVVVQKSLREGFGVAVAEALWKRRPVVASAVGGILEQIQEGVEGLLVQDPTDVNEFASQLHRVLEDPGLARRLGEAGRERVRTCYLSVGALEHWAHLVRLLLDVGAGGPAAAPEEPERREAEPLSHRI